MMIHHIYISGSCFIILYSENRLIISCRLCNVILVVVQISTLRLKPGSCLVLNKLQTGFGKESGTKV